MPLEESLKLIVACTLVLKAKRSTEFIVKEIDDTLEQSATPSIRDANIVKMKRKPKFELTMMVNGSAEE